MFMEYFERKTLFLILRLNPPPTKLIILLEAWLLVGIIKHPMASSSALSCSFASQTAPILIFGADLLPFQKHFVFLQCEVSVLLLIGW